MADFSTGRRYFENIRSFNGLKIIKDKIVFKYFYLCNIRRQYCNGVKSGWVGQLGNEAYQRSKTWRQKG